MISMDKKYRTRNGREVRVLCVDRGDELYPVVALITNKSNGDEVCEYYTKEGFYYENKKESLADLIEVSQYDHIKKGDVVLVWNYGEERKTIRFFIDYLNGKVLCSQRIPLKNSEIEWDYCELYTGLNNGD